MLTYVAIITRQQSDNFLASFPDFPDVASQAHSFEEAVDTAKQSLMSHINHRCQVNDTLPIPTSFAEVRSGLDLHKAAAIPIRV